MSGDDEGLSAGAIEALASEGLADGAFAEDASGAALEEPEGPGLQLSAEEGEALLDAIRSGATGENVRMASLGAADEPMRRALRRADEMLPALEDTLRDALLRANAAPSAMSHEPSSVVTHETLAGSIDPTAAVWSIHGGDPRAPLGTVVVGPALATDMLERRLGAPSTLAGARVASRAPSPLERRVLEPLVRELMNVAAAPFVPDTAALQLAAPRAEASAVSRFAPCLSMVVRLTLKSGTASDVTVALFSATFASRPESASKGKGASVLEAVADVQVDAVAVLGRCASTVRHLLALEAGAVLRLDGAPDRPIDVWVDGVPVLRGVPVVKDGNMAIEVTT